MRKVLKVAALLFVVQTIVAGAVLLVSRSPLSVNRVAYWHLNDCTPPCWMGIIPGLTPVAVARQRIATALSVAPFHTTDVTSRSVSDINAVFQLQDQNDPTGSSAEIQILGEGRVIGNTYSAGIAYNIMVGSATEPNNQLPSLAEVFEAFGAPTAVVPIGSGLSELVYTDVTCSTILRVGLDGPIGTSWTRPIRFFQLLEPADPSNHEACDPASFGSSWADYWQRTDVQPYNSGVP